MTGRWLSGWLPVVLWTLLIFLLSTRPYTAYFSNLEGSSHRIFQRYLQYPVHVAEYGALALLWVRALIRHSATRQWVAWATLGAVVLTALADESIQHLVPTRSFAFRDLLMDGTGGILAVTVSRWVFPISSSRG